MTDLCLPSTKAQLESFKSKVVYIVRSMELWQDYAEWAPTDIPADLSVSRQTCFLFSDAAVERAHHVFTAPASRALTAAVRRSILEVRGIPAASAQRTRQQKREYAGLGDDLLSLLSNQMSHLAWEHSKQQSSIDSFVAAFFGVWASSSMQIPPKGGSIQSILSDCEDLHPLRQLFEPVIDALGGMPLPTPAVELDTEITTTTEVPSKRRRKQGADARRQKAKEAPAEIDSIADTAGNKDRRADRLHNIPLDNWEDLLSAAGLNLAAIARGVYSLIEGSLSHRDCRFQLLPPSESCDALAQMDSVKTEIMAAFCGSGIITNARAEILQHEHRSLVLAKSDMLAHRSPLPQASPEYIMPDPSDLLAMPIDDDDLFVADSQHTAAHGGWSGIPRLPLPDTMDQFSSQQAHPSQDEILNSIVAAPGSTPSHTILPLSGDCIVTKWTMGSVPLIDQMSSSFDQVENSRDLILKGADQFSGLDNDEEGGSALATTSMASDIAANTTRHQRKAVRPAKHKAIVPPSSEEDSDGASRGPLVVQHQRQGTAAGSSPKAGKRRRPKTTATDDQWRQKAKMSLKQTMLASNA